MEAVLLFFAFLVGSFFGSFLNLCIHRLPRNESIINPPSRCYSCGTRVQWYDNLPIIGWLMLGGKCRWCGSRFSSRYLWSEVSVGLLTAGTWWYVTHGAALAPDGPVLVPAVTWTDPRFGFAWSLPVGMGIALAALLPAVYLAFTAAMIDHDHEIIPDELTVPFQLAAPVLAAVASTPVALSEYPLPMGWLLVDDPNGGTRVNPTAFVADTWMVVVGILILLALSLTTLRWIYGSRLGSEAWRERDQRDVRRGFWWFAACTLAQLGLCTVAAYIQEPGGRLGPAGLLAVLLAQAMLGSLAGWSIPWLVGLLGSAGFRKSAMGFGDVKLLAPLGAFIGPMGVVYAFFLAAIIGTAIGLPKLLISGSRRLRFGPCLALGALLVLAVGPLLHHWFASRFVSAWGGSAG